MKYIHKKQEQGMLTVEAVLSLVPFILVILGIISFINVFQVHNKIQYALFQMGNELACYTYLLEITGVRDADATVQSDVKKHTEQIRDFFSEIENMGDALDSLINSEEEESAGERIGDVVEAGESTVEAGIEFFSDPKRMLGNIVFDAIGKGRDKLVEWLTGLITEQMLGYYLDQSFSSSNTMDADEFLRNYGVVDGLNGLSFEGTEVFADEGKMIDIVVTYKLEIQSFKLFFKDPTITVVQRCAVPAWLDGDGVQYEE